LREERRAAALVEASTLVGRLKEMGHTPEDDRAEEALAFGIATIRSKTDSTRDRLVASRMVLEFTKQKPAARSDVTIQNAEDFLEALALQEDASLSVSTAAPAAVPKAKAVARAPKAKATRDTSRDSGK
jgi:hypothetical protein